MSTNTLGLPDNILGGFHDGKGPRSATEYPGLIYMTNPKEGETVEARDMLQAVVTPEMIAAGAQVFLENYPDSGTGDAIDREMVCEIYVAMVMARKGMAPDQ